MLTTRPDCLLSFQESLSVAFICFLTQVLHTNPHQTPAADLCFLFCRSHCEHCSLNDNGIGHSGAAALAAALRENSSLIHIS